MYYINLQHVSSHLIKSVLLFLQIKIPFPESGLIYDYKLDDAGITQTTPDDDEDEGEDKKQKVQYSHLIG